MRTKTITKFALALGGILILAACSSGGSSDTPTTEAGGGNSGATDSAKSHKLVDALQKDLQTLGYYAGSVDGVYGPDTTEAIKELQEDQGITVDGKYGPQTQKAMVNALGGDGPSNAITELQVELRSLGHYDGEIDGLYGEETIAGVKEAQDACGITVDGIYGSQTHDCLLELLEQA